MYIKIYFNEKPLFLCDAIDETITPLIHHDDSVFIDDLDTHTIKTMIHEMQQEQVHAGIFYHHDLQQLKLAFQKKFLLVQAAGGLVKNENNDILVIFRRGKWDLPKGKLDEGEKIEDCAIREVEEETGLRNAKLIAPLTITYHTYQEGTKHILKESHWFTMSVSGAQILIPQTEEGIFDIRWIEQSKIPGFLPDSFPLISDIMEAAKQKGFIVF